MTAKIVLGSLLMAFPMSLFAGNHSKPASVREVYKEILTYPYSNPREFVEPGRMYPYHRFDNYAVKGELKKWKMIEMENDYIKIWVMPQIGGKIWGAIDKKSGKEFLYYNHVVKFRDVASRGPWTSGGLEMNFGIIGHAPWCSSQVDYHIEKNKDGSVSCTVGGEDVSLGTNWRVSIILPPDEAFVETKVLWYNGTSWEKPYYQWMNAGIKSKGNLEYTYPGNRYLTHDGKSLFWPEDEQGHKINWYENNNFGHYKSYHVTGKYSDYWGAYWHNDNFGMGHSASYNDKLGKKVWIWGLSRYGMVWENLLTDKDGQYTEVQSGRLFNQSIGTSYKTPFKHYSFMPASTNSWSEFWYPVKGTEGITYSNKLISFSWKEKNNSQTLSLYAVSPVNAAFKIVSKGKIVYDKNLKLDPTEETKLVIDNTAIDLTNYAIYLGEDMIYNTEINDKELSRPSLLPDDFNHNSAYGLYLQGREFERQNFFISATEKYKASLEKEPYFQPSLVGLAGIFYQQNEIEKAQSLIKKALQVDTYDAAANHLYGLISLKLKQESDALDAFSVASLSPAYKSAATQQIAMIYLRNKDIKQTEHFLLQSLQSNPLNIESLQLEILVNRLSGQKKKASELVNKLLITDPLNYVARYEKYLLSNDSADLEGLKGYIISEYWFESYLSIASFYENTGLYADAISLLSAAPNNPQIFYKTAQLLHLSGQEEKAIEMVKKANAQSPSLIFPHRQSDEELYKWVKTIEKSWKPNYYLAMLLLQFDRKEEAVSLLKACGTDPDFYAFYITRSNYADTAESDLIKATELAPERFVATIALAKYYQKEKRFADAVGSLESFYKKEKNNYYINMQLAKAYLEAGKYTNGIDLMNKIVILPNEGALDGRNTWRECNLRFSIDLIRKKEYTKAIHYITEARRWPESLGVGKPYEDMTDERLEDILEWFCSKQQRKSNADLLKKIENECTGLEPNASSNLISVFAMLHNGNNEKAASFMEAWTKRKPNDKIAKWCMAAYQSDWKKAGEISLMPLIKKEALPFEIIFDDREFLIMEENAPLFKDIFESLR